MRVIRSAGQNVSPSDDGRLFDQAFTDGLFEEATITATGGNTITLSALYGIICGRDFTAEAQTISATLPDSDTATGYVYVEFDTSSEDIITIGTALAPFTPTHEDINTNGAVVQMVIAQYEASAVAVTSVTPTYMTATAGSVKAGSIATVEKSPAVANHSIGEFILYGGDLYEVTSAIAAGETLVVGTNIAAASIGEELTALNNGLTYSYGQQVNILGYNSSSNMWTAPQDGFVFAQTWNNDSTLDVWFSASIFVVNLKNGSAGYVRSYATFVKKGITMWFGGSGTNRSCYYTPLVRQ